MAAWSRRFPLSAASRTRPSKPCVSTRRSRPWPRRIWTWLVERLAVIYQAQGATLLEAGARRPMLPCCSSSSRVIEGVAPGVEATRLLPLTGGEMFPLGALLTGRAAVNRYVAASDVFCYRLSASDFHALLGRSPAFSEFCTRRIASLLEESQRAVRAEYALALDDENRYEILKSGAIKDVGGVGSSSIH